MMTMINANFTNQDSKAGVGADAAEKEANTDQFTMLMAGLFAPATAPPPVAETTAAETVKASEPFFAGDEKGIPVAGIKEIKTEGPAPTGKFPLGILLPQDGGVTPGAIPDPPPNTNMAFTDPLVSPIDPRFKPDTNAVPFVKNEALPEELSGRTCLGLGMDPEPVKPLVKDLKTQANIFEPATAVTSEPGPIKMAKNFAVMEKEKAALAANFKENLIQILPGSGTDTVDAEPTHFDHNYVADPHSSLAMGDEVWTPVKLRKLISKVTELTTGATVNENTQAIKNELAMETVRSVLPKVTAMLEQIAPKMMELAAAAISHGKQVLKMRLHPAELGTVEITLERNEAGVLDAHLKTSNDAARDILSRGMDQLRDSLQNAGWQIGQMEISTGHFSNNFSTGGGQNQKDAWQHDTSQGHPDASAFEQSPTISDDPSLPDADRLVSLRA